MLRALGISLVTLMALATLAVPVGAQGGANYRYPNDSSGQIIERPLPPPGSFRRSGSPRLPYPGEEETAQDEELPPYGAPDDLPEVGHQLDVDNPAENGLADEDDPDQPIRPPLDIGVAPYNPRTASPPVVVPANPASTTAALPPEDRPEEGAPKALPPHLRRQLVNYQTKEPAGTIIVDTSNTHLFLVLGHGKAIRYGIGVGREGFTWAGTERISRMKEWPDWFPPSEMIERQPYLPRMMAGGPGNPLGARALYLGRTLYRIHGTNQPSTIGSFVSSGCIRLLNEDIEDLYSRVQVGTRVMVLAGKAPNTAQPNAAPGASATRASVMVDPETEDPPVPSAPVPRSR